MRYLSPDPDDVQNNPLGAPDDAPDDTPNPEPPARTDGELEKLRRELAERDERLSKLQQQNESLQKVEQWAKTLVAGGGSQQEVETSVSSLMAHAGYTNEEIESYLQTLRGGSDDPETERDERKKMPPKVEDDDREQLRREIAELRAQVTRQGSDQLRERFDKTVSTVMGNPKLAELMKRFDGDDQGANSVRGLLTDAVRDTMLKELRARRDREARQFGRTLEVTDSLLQEVATKATESVYGTYRSVIASPQGLGRSAETDAGEDPLAALVADKPVPPPQFQAGDDVSSVSEKVRSHMLDSFARAVTDTGETKV